MDKMSVIEYLKGFVSNPSNDRNKRVTCKKLITYFNSKKSDANEMLDYTIEEFEVIIGYLKPTSLIEISNLIYRVNDVLRDYCLMYNYEWNNKNLCLINKEQFWNKLKEENDLKRYFNYNQYKYIIDYLKEDILYDGNGLYIMTLFMSVYEGMYDKGLSEIRNLRLSDINTETNVVTLRNDKGDIRELMISDELKENLIKLSDVKVWNKGRANSDKLTYMPLVGEYDDSIFKVVMYSNNNTIKSYREFYYRRLKAISNDFLGYSTTPLQIFVSGIINRVYEQMLQFDVTLDDIKNNKKSFTTSAKFFIKKECEKVNYNINIYTFMRVLKSYTEVFDSNIITREEIIDKNKCS